MRYKRREPETSDRRRELWAWLSTGDQPTLREISQRFGVGSWTARMDIAYLREAGYLDPAPYKKATRCYTVLIPLIDRRESGRVEE